MRELIRLIATLTIWIVFATVMGVALTSSTGPLNNANGGEITGIVAIMAAAATICTVAIWVGARRDEIRQRNTAHIARGKIKRVERDRVGRLIETLDDDEIYDLEALLLARHDESAQHSQSREQP
jgi:hypothetical protein